MKSISVLKEEIDKRTTVQLPLSNQWISSRQPVIALGVKGYLDIFPDDVQEVIASIPPTTEEGYKIVVNAENKTVVVVGADARGLFYGMGKLMRTMEMR